MHLQCLIIFNSLTPLIQFFCFVLTVLQNIEVKSSVKHIKENLYHQFIKQNVFVITKAPINSQFQRWPSRITRTYFFDNSRKILSQNVFLQYESSDIYHLAVMINANLKKGKMLSTNREILTKEIFMWSVKVQALTV